MRHRLTAALVAGLLAVGGPASAGGDAECSPTDLQCQAGADGTSGSAGSDGSPGSPSSPGSPDGSRQRPPECVEVDEVYERLGADCNGCLWYDHAVPAPHGSRGRIERTPPYPLPPTSVWRYVICYPAAMGSWVAIPAAAEPDQPPVSALALAERARDSFRLPAPSPGTSPPRATLVNLPTYLFVDRAGWQTHTATAAAAGTTVRVTARPRWVQWTTGDGGATACAGAGAPYRRGDAGPECGHLYRRSGPYRLTAAVTYDITWVCTGQCDGPGGTLEPLTARASLPLTVLQARSQLVQD
jgi:hypothetical protein